MRSAGVSRDATADQLKWRPAPDCRLRTRMAHWILGQECRQPLSQRLSAPETAPCHSIAPSGAVRRRTSFRRPAPGRIGPWRPHSPRTRRRANPPEIPVSSQREDSYSLGPCHCAPPGRGTRNAVGGPWNGQCSLSTPERRREERTGTVSGRCAKAHEQEDTAIPMQNDTLRVFCFPLKAY